MLVLQRMFPSTTEKFNSSLLDWDTFVRATEDKGLAIFSVGGSEVGFARPGQGHIVLHHPHKEGRPSKIYQIKLQVWGKRMRYHFDWDRGSFVHIKSILTP